MIPLKLHLFDQLKAEVEAYQRLCGYYIVKLLDISAWRDAGQTQEEIADSAFQYFDDHEWPPLELRCQNQTWTKDYAVEADEARVHTIEALVGGSNVGHTKPTIPRPQAELFVQRFEALFEEPRCHFIRMGFGNPEYVFQHGVAIISQSRAGILWVVEDD